MPPLSKLNQPTPQARKRRGATANLTAPAAVKATKVAAQSSRKPVKNIIYQQYTWSRATINIINLLINLFIFGLLIYIAFNLSCIMNKILQMFIKNINKNRSDIIKTSSSIADGVLKNQEVNTTLTKIITKQTDPITNKLNTLNPSADVPRPTSPVSQPSADAPPLPTPL